MAGLTLGQGAQVLASNGYRDRVRAAMERQCVAVMGEAVSTPVTAVQAKRKILAAAVLKAPAGYVDMFLSAVASDQGGNLTWSAPVNIASSTNANPIVVTTSVVHGLSVGDVVEVAGHLVNTNANGVWLLATVGSTTQFTVPVNSNGVGGATGTAAKMFTDIEINQTVIDRFTALAGTYTGDPG